MKKIGIQSIVIGLLLLVTRCSTIDVAAVRKTQDVGVAVIGVDKYINMGDFSITAMIQKLSESDKFDVKPIAKNVHKKTFGELQEKMPFNMISEEEVIGSERYKNFKLFEDKQKRKNYMKASNVVSIKNYKQYNPVYLNKKRRKRLFKSLPDKAQAMLCIGIDYTLIRINTMVPGMSKAKIKANLRMTLSKPNGDKIMKILKHSKSDKSMEVVLSSAMMDPEKVQPMCKEATDKVLKSAEKFVEEKLAKSS